MFVIAFGLFGWAGYDYVESGVESSVIDITGEAGRSDPINLDPSMSPMRGVLKVDYDSDLLEADNKAFTYNATLQGSDSEVLFDAKGELRDKREENTPVFSTKSSLTVLATFDIPAAGAYTFSWKIIPQKATITVRSIVLRRNVRPAQWPLVILGAVSFVLGIVSLQYRRRKAGKQTERRKN